MAVAIACRLGVRACDVYDYFSRKDKVERNPQVATKVNFASQVVVILCNIAEDIALLKGAPAETLKKVKICEAFFRALNIPCKVINYQLENEPKGFISKVRLGEITLAPISDFIRVVAESQMRSDEYCRPFISELENIVKFNSITKIAADIGLVSTMVDKAIYGDRRLQVNQLQISGERLEARCQQLRRERNHFRIASLIAQNRYDVLANRYQQLRANLEGPINLLLLRRIPAPLHDDIVFSEHICPLTLDPIRKIVGDPDRKHFYEEDEILEWLRHNETSPMTREPLTPDQLIRYPQIQATIDRRLRYHQGQLDAYLEQSPLLQQSLQTATPTHVQ